ncbi:hypothetical protein CAL29_11500 [Bordetella genomosp. 10]|uniref:DUF4148 domain-containing protein n=1 Tax=Bordetella genomosp. 10 TaxID=1416804 RepID=A0A261SB05_9BORD|nr:DUF4148 domain-containing protein [Bordetella genomosp. 10]OZI34167.1 hypothetical protein CAL29_11500 [Bordetella genomosp. 10]
MKTKTIASSLIISFALIGGAAQADNSPFKGVYGQNDSSVTREQVQADLQQAKNAGLVSREDTDNVAFSAQTESGVSRDQVANEAAKAPGALSDLDNVPFQG